MRDLAAKVASHSKAQRLKVGVVIYTPKLDGLETVCCGWNKTLNDSPMEYLDEENNLVTHSDVIHAEFVAIRLLLAADYNLASRAEMILVSTHSPCIECAKLIYASGIQTVRFGQLYRDSAGVDFLRQAGIDIEVWDELQWAPQEKKTVIKL